MQKCESYLDLTRVVLFTWPLPVAFPVAFRSDRRLLSQSVVQKLGHLVVEWSFHALGVIGPGFGEVWQCDEAVPVRLHSWELSVEQAVADGIEQVEELREIKVEPGEIGSSDPLAVAHALDDFG